MTGKARIIQEKLFSLSYLPCSSTLTHLAFFVLLPLNNCSANQAFSRASPSFKREGGERAKRVTSWKSSHITYIVYSTKQKTPHFARQGALESKVDGQPPSHLDWDQQPFTKHHTLSFPSSVHSLSKTKILMQLCRDGQEHSLLCFLNTNRFYALLAFTFRC